MGLLIVFCVRTGEKSNERERLVPDGDGNRSASKTVRLRGSERFEEERERDQKALRFAI